MRKIVSLIGLSLGITACSQSTPTIEQAASDLLKSKPVALKTVGSVEIYDQRALRFIDPAQKVSVLAEGFEWTEGPVWVNDGQYVLFSDIPNNKIHQYIPGKGLFDYLDPAGGTGLNPGDDTSGSNGLLISPDGHLILMQQGDRRVAKMTAPLNTPKVAFKTLAGSYKGKRLNSPNDAVYADNGALFFTDPPYGMKDAFNDSRKELPFQGVFRLDTNGDVTLLDDSLHAPNGVEISNDNKTLYVAVSDPKKAAWYAYDLDSKGNTSNRRVFFDSTALIHKEGEQGYPDGMVVHSTGVIFATGPGGVWLFDEAGKALAKIRTGELTANCTLSADEKYLYITADDYLMGIEIK